MPSGDEVRATTTSRADAYFNYTMGHIAEQQYEQTSRSEYATQAIEYYKKAYALDPKSPVIGERLAEMYWDHQRHEGEPVFNEFLGELRDPALVELAVEAADEVEALADSQRLLSEALDYLRGAQHLRDEQKLLSQLRRTSQQPPRDEIDLLKELQAKRRQPDLRRV